MRLEVREIGGGKHLQEKELEEVGRVFGSWCRCDPYEGEREGRKVGWEAPQTAENF